MSVVGLTMVSGETVYVNPDRVTTLARAPGKEADQATQVSFGHQDSVTVKGDIDHIAFQLFPTGVR